MDFQVVSESNYMHSHRAIQLQNWNWTRYLEDLVLKMQHWKQKNTFDKHWNATLANLHLWNVYRNENLFYAMECNNLAKYRECTTLKENEYSKCIRILILKRNIFCGQRRRRERENAATVDIFQLTHKMHIYCIISV